MDVEIERKFLVRKEFLPDLVNFPTKNIWQAYLLSEKNRNIRIRQKGNQAFITLKGGNNNLVRKEFEYEISIDDFLEIKEMYKDAPAVKKKRYIFEHKGFDWEIDVFEEDNNGLILAEIELENENQAFEKPQWLGEEVTHNPLYLNSSLAKNPYKNWEKKL